MRREGQRGRLRRNGVERALHPGREEKEGCEEEKRRKDVETDQESIPHRSRLCKRLLHSSYPRKTFPKAGEKALSEKDVPVPSINVCTVPGKRVVR